MGDHENSDSEDWKDASRERHECGDEITDDQREISGNRGTGSGGPVGAGAQVQSVEQTEFPVCQLEPQQLQYPQC